MAQPAQNHQPLSLQALIKLPLPESIRPLLKNNAARIITAVDEQDAEAAATYVVQAVVAALKSRSIDAPFTIHTLRKFIDQHNGWGPIELAMGNDTNGSANGAAAIVAYLDPANLGNVRSLPPASERPQARYDRQPAPSREPEQRRSAPAPATRQGTRRDDDGGFQRQPEETPNRRVAERQSAVAGASSEKGDSDDRTRFDQRVKTPRGVALFPYLDKPDYEYNKDGLYKVELIIDPKEDAAKEMFATMNRIRDAFFEEVHADLKARKKFEAMEQLVKRDFGTPDRDDQGNRTGLVRIRAKSKAQWTRSDGVVAQRQPLAFNANAERIEMPAIFSGSELILSCIARPYYKPDANQVGCSLLLEAVQIAKLVGPRGGGTPTSAEAHGFHPVRGR